MSRELKHIWLSGQQKVIIYNDQGNPCSEMHRQDGRSEVVHDLQGELPTGT